MPFLERADYHLRVREPEFDGHRMLRSSKRDVHIHVFPAWSREVTRYRLLRDCLRRDAFARRLYEDVKKQLAKHGLQDMNAYADAKGAIIEKLIEQEALWQEKQ